MLTWISLHFFSRGGPTAALRTYYEVVHSYPAGTNVLKTREQPNIPVGYSYFPTEIIRPPRRSVLFHRWAGNSLNRILICGDDIFPLGGSRHRILYLNPSMKVGDISPPMRNLSSWSAICEQCLERAEELLPLSSQKTDIPHVYEDYGSSRRLGR